VEFDTTGNRGNAQADGCHLQDTTIEIVILHHGKVEGEEEDDE